MRKRILLLVLSSFLVVVGALLYRHGLTGEGMGKSGDGQALGLATDNLADKLPPDIGFYPGALIKSYDEKISGFQLAGESADGDAAIRRYFRQKLNELGWNNIEDLKFRKAGRGLLAVTLISPPDRPTVIILDYTQD